MLYKYIDRYSPTINDVISMVKPTPQLDFVGSSVVLVITESSKQTRLTV